VWVQVSMMGMLKNLVAECRPFQAKEFVDWLSPDWIVRTLLPCRAPESIHGTFSNALRIEALSLLGNIIACGEPSGGKRHCSMQSKYAVCAGVGLRGHFTQLSIWRRSLSCWNHLKH